MLNFWGNMDDSFGRIYRIITKLSRHLKTDWNQPEIAPIKKNKKRFVPKYFKSFNPARKRFNFKQPAAKAGYRRGQRRKYDKI